MSTISKTFIRSFSFFVFVIALSAVAHAACGPIACDSRPVVVPPAPQSVFLPPSQDQGPLVSTAFCGTNACNPGATCSTCTDPRVQPTTLPGVYSNDYNYTVTSQRNTSGIPYIIPTAGGLLESPTIPLTNSVDQFYATHSVMGGRVVRTAPNPPNLARMVNYNNYWGANTANDFQNYQAPGYNAQTAFAAPYSAQAFRPAGYGYGYGFGL